MSVFLPSTQPFLPTQPSPRPEDDIWGWLIPLADGLTHLALNQAEVRAGRDHDECQVVFTKSAFQHKGMGLSIEKTSRVHCIFSRGSRGNGPSLTDTSMNGTWIDKMRIGKGNKAPLSHGNIISVLSQEMEVFYYLDKVTMERDFHSSLTSKYLVGKVLGEGTTSLVRLGFRRNDFKKFALKIINTKSWPSKYSAPMDMMAEVNVLADIRHPCITLVHEVVDMQDEDLLVIVMEYAEGGELFDQVVEDFKNNDIDERKSKFQFYQIVDAVKHLHSNHICHRDLKLENLLLAQDKPFSLVKVSDFGLSKVLEEDLLQSYVGTPIYMAPEVLAMGERSESRGYTYKADCWSLGVILYVLLAGKHPFSKGEEMVSHIMQGKVRSMTGGVWDKVTTTAKSLVRALLVTDPEKRLAAEEVLQHPWFSEDRHLCSLAIKVMAGGQVDSLENISMVNGGCGVSTVKKVKEVPLIDLTQDSEE